MNIIETEFTDLYIIDPLVHKDKRGYFFESYRDDIFKEKIGNINFIQENESYSTKGILRGLHFQTEPYSQSKLVRCVKGEVLDVVVDIRKNSNTYGQHIIENLSEDNHHQLYIPEGMAHGFLTLSDETIFCYKCSDYYNKEAEDCILWNDKLLNINWGTSNPIVSQKDQQAKNFSSFVTPFI